MAKVGTSKGGEKQWQTIPKNLPRMQCAKSHIGSITGLWFLPDRLNTNELMKQIDTVKVSAVEIIYKQHCSLHSVEDNANKSAIYFYAVTRIGHICVVLCGSLTTKIAVFRIM